MAGFVILGSATIGGPYVCGVRPRTPQERRYVALVLAFLAIMLPLMASLR